jgi:hypothetical protein
MLKERDRDVLGHIVEYCDEIILIVAEFVVYFKKRYR